MDYSASAHPKPTRKKRKNHSRKKLTSARRKLEIQCDGLTKILVHRRDNNICLKCGTSDADLQAAHILPKGKYPLMRFVLDNMLTLCWRDHMEWAHKDPVGFVDWIEAVWPGRIQRLRISARMGRPQDLKELSIALQDEVERGVGERN